MSDVRVEHRPSTLVVHFRFCPMKINMLLNSVYLFTAALAGTQVIHAQRTCSRGSIPTNDLCLGRLNVDIDETHGFAECENALQRVLDTALYQQIRNATDAASGNQLWLS